MPPKDFDPNLAPYGLIAVQRIISAGENGSDACTGCVLNFGQKYADLMQYKEARERASEQAMAELAQQSQELGMGYE